MIENFFNPAILASAWRILLAGLENTVLLSLLVVPLGVIGGVVLASLAGIRHALVRWPLMAWVDFFRAFPPLVLLIFIFYGLPFLGLRLDGFTAAVLALTLNGSSYFGEIFRAGLESIPRGQREAARSTGLTWLQSMIYVVIPQGTRNMLPDLVSNTVELVKQTSIASVVALQELLRSAQIAQGLSYNPTPLVVAALVYFIMFWPFVRIVSRMQKRAFAQAA